MQQKLPHTPFHNPNRNIVYALCLSEALKWKGRGDLKRSNVWLQLSLEFIDVDSLPFDTQGSETSGSFSEEMERRAKKAAKFISVEWERLTKREDLEEVQVKIQKAALYCQEWRLTIYDLLETGTSQSVEDWMNNAIHYVQHMSSAKDALEFMPPLLEYLSDHRFGEDVIRSKKTSQLSDLKGERIRATYYMVQKLFREETDYFQKLLSAYIASALGVVKTKEQFSDSETRGTFNQFLLNVTKTHLKTNMLK